MSKLFDKLIQSKQQLLLMTVSNSLSGIISDFRNKLRGYFSNQQKEVIKNIKDDNFVNFYDKNKYVQKLIALYSEIAIKVFKKSENRVKSEAEVDEIKEELINYILTKYISLTINDMVNKIEQTTYKKLNKYYNDNIKRMRD